MLIHSLVYIKFQLYSQALLNSLFLWEFIKFLACIYISLYLAVIFEAALTRVSPRNKYTANIHYFLKTEQDFATFSYIISKELKKIRT